MYTQLNVKTVLFKTNQVSKSTQFSSIWPIYRARLAATTLRQGKPGSDGNKRVLRIPQSSSSTGAWPSDCLVSYPGYVFKESYPTAEMQSVYSAAKSIFKAVVKNLNSEVFFSTGFHTKVNEPSLPYYLLIARGRIIGCIPFPIV